jgi:hypothetical protein
MGRSIQVTDGWERGSPLRASPMLVEDRLDKERRRCLERRRERGTTRVAAFAADETQTEGRRR